MVVADVKLAPCLGVEERVEDAVAERAADLWQKPQPCKPCEENLHLSLLNLCESCARLICLN